MKITELVLKAISWTGWEIVGNILSAIGIISLILAFLRFIYDIKIKKWNDNISIQDYPFDFDVEMSEQNAIYSTIWTETPTEYMSTIVFKPVGCIIPKLKVIRLNEAGKFQETVEVYKNLAPNDSVCFRIE